jgi:hypothetical protein
MIIVENGIQDKKLEELEQKNSDELESLERLIILFEDIKNIENSNLDYAKEILNDVKFKEFLILGNLGILCKAYFESYYETKIKQTQNLKKIIDIMKFRSYSKTYNDNNDFVIINDCRNLSNVSENINSQKYIGKKEVLEIIDSMKLINEFNNDYNNNYIRIIGKELDKLKKIESLNDLDLLKGIKEEKIIFEIKLEEICENGLETEEFNFIKNKLLSDNSNEQKYINWTINCLNKYRSKLTIIEEKVYNSFKILFEIIFTKLSENKLYQSFDLAIILIQTFSKKNGNEESENILLEEEFKNNKIFQNSDLWLNLIIQKSKDLFEKINEESKDNKENKDNTDNITYIKENIESILVSYIFTMKDFNIDDITKRDVIEKFCTNEEYIKYNFNIDELMSYPTD